ncbi:MAG: hypothetical protein LBN21_08380 [Treponema sp.]|nr:hypothetical protein [Treponema sp.]
MGSFLQILALVTIGMALLWFGYTLFLGSGKRLFVVYPKKQKRPPGGESRPGDPQTCPVCSARLEKGRLVKSMAFPSFTGKDRLMHIKGCAYCIDGDRARICPVCGVQLHENEILIARIFERPHRKSHVHVLGCSRCRGPGGRPR